jgi:hypothetical protein
MSFVSPNEMMARAKEIMLDGNEPASKDDWATIVNFLAHNIDEEVAMSACLLLSKLYDMPLTDDEIREIVVFQLMSKRADRGSNGA